MGQYLHKYQTIEEFEAAYNNDGSSVVTAITISVSAGTYVFDHQEYGGGFYWKDENNNEAWTEKRTPAVGDEAYDITGGWHNVTVASVLSETPEATYIEPWVSLTLEGLPIKVKIYCHGTGYYHGMEYIGPDNTYGDYHKWIEINSEGVQLSQYYYTTTRKLSPGDPVYWSMEGGVDMHEPCAWVDSFLESDHRVDYNKTKGNKVVVEYFGDSGEVSVVSFTDDFVPGSTGAIYEFRFSTTPSQIFVVGETPENWGAPFTGRWLPQSDWGSGDDTVLYVSEPNSSGCYVVREDNSCDIGCKWV